MVPTIISQSPDLMRLWNEGHVMEIRIGYLLVHEVPYVNTQRQIRRGTLVTSLNLNGDQTKKPDTHVLHFIGEFPCHKDGKPINQLQHGGGSDLGGIKVNYSFSNKPPNGYEDYYHKIKSYIRLISNPAKSIDDSVTEKTFEILESDNDDSVFEYVDTNSSRADIVKIAMKIASQKVAIVGLGGTGSYLLDFLAKTRVQEIHLIDGDYFSQHNAFRAPGAASKETFFRHMKKTDYWQEVYSKMHRNIFSHSVLLDESNVGLLKEMNFVFICIDAGPAKKVIFEFLEENSIPFIDVGIGLQVVDEALTGGLRVTTCTPGTLSSVRKYLSFADGGNNEYDRNIQISELNSLNASLAIIKWKKLFGFYADHDKEINTTYSIFTNEINNDNVSA